MDCMSAKGHTATGQQKRAGGRRRWRLRRRWMQSSNKLILSRVAACIAVCAQSYIIFFPLRILFSSVFCFVRYAFFLLAFAALDSCMMYVSGVFFVLSRIPFAHIQVCENSTETQQREWRKPRKSVYNLSANKIAWCEHRSPKPMSDQINLALLHKLTCAKWMHCWMRL